jgi:hypothetical protein
MSVRDQGRGTPSLYKLSPLISFTIDVKLLLFIIADMNTIEWSKKAAKQLKKLPANSKRIIFYAVDGLTSFPNSQNTKQLTNLPPESWPLPCAV